MYNIGYAITLCSKLLKNKLNKELEKEGITAAQFAVIKDIEVNSKSNKNLENITAVAIGERLDMDKPTISGIINRLACKGYVEKLPHPTDKRASILILTDCCTKMLQTFESISEDVISSAIKGVSGEDLTKFNEVVCKLINNMKWRGDCTWENI